IPPPVDTTRSSLGMPCKIMDSYVRKASSPSRSKISAMRPYVFSTASSISTKGICKRSLNRLAAEVCTLPIKPTNSVVLIFYSLLINDLTHDLKGGETTDQR